MDASQILYGIQLAADVYRDNSTEFDGGPVSDRNHLFSLWK